MSDIKTNLDNGLAEFYLNLDIDTIKESLKEDGVDVNAETVKISAYVKRLKFKHKAVTQKQHSDSLLDKIASKFQDAIEKNIDKPIATLKSLIESKQLNVQFRNLDKLTPEQIKDIIKGKNLVDLMDELDNEVD